MPNNQLDPSIARAMGSAFGGGQPAPVQQQSAPTPPPSADGSGGGGLFQALSGLLKPSPGPSPYDKLADPSKR